MKPFVAVRNFTPSSYALASAAESTAGMTELLQRDTARVESGAANTRNSEDTAIKRWLARGKIKWVKVDFVVIISLSGKPAKQRPTIRLNILRSETIAASSGGVIPGKPRINPGRNCGKVLPRRLENAPRHWVQRQHPSLSDGHSFASNSASLAAAASHSGVRRASSFSFSRISRLRNEAVPPCS